jgi:hypothetical protein
MTEKLLQFIWQFQYFNRDSLSTTDGQNIQIISPGILNKNQGPDFEQARLKIGDTSWAGSVELHIKSSDWIRHRHHNDERYQKIILHVVWLNDGNITDQSGESIPALVLENRVSKLLLNTFDNWMQASGQIPCADSLSKVNTIVWQAWKQRLLIERMMDKYELIRFHLKDTSNHWEEVCWRMLCRYFGGNINRVSFEQLAVSLPVQILGKHKNQIHQLEALLLGQAGLLHKNFTEDYPLMLYKEYQFLQHKYKLRVINLPPSFLRMRPSNFPTIRLAQLAMLIHNSQQLFSKITTAAEPGELSKLFDVTANDYWHYHYKFDEASEFFPKKLGHQMWETLLINAIVPLLFAYGVYNNDEKTKEKALSWLDKIPAEKNSVIAPFTRSNISIERAYDSQALLQLKKEYCDAKRCLECSIGNAILKHQD